jgi:putative cofactor-binding repeat protein
MPVITFAGENLIAQQQQAGQNLIIDQIIFANINGLDDTLTPDRSQTLPSAENIQLTNPITKDGMLTSNTVVYSTVLTSDQGTFDFNWMGLYSSEHGVLVAVAYVPTQSKIATLGPIIGNVITKNFAIEFNGAADVTGINISAESWQIDYTARLVAMDRLQRKSIKNIYGRTAFITNAFKCEFNGSDYVLRSGEACIGGLFISLESDYVLLPGSVPQTVWLDVSQNQTMGGVENSFLVVLNAGQDIEDYVSDGVEHTVIEICRIFSTDNIQDYRINLLEDFQVWHKGNLSFIKPYKNIDEACQDISLYVGKRISIDGYFSESGGGAGEYVCVAGDTGASDGVLYHDTANGLQLKLIIDGQINIKQGGVKADGVADDTQAFKNIISALDAVTINAAATDKINLSERINFKSNQIFNGNACEVILNNGAAGLGVLGGVGSEVPLSVAITEEGTIEIATQSAHGLARGDLAFLQSSINCLSTDAGEMALGYDANYKSFFGEFVIVSAVISSTVFKIFTGTRFDNYPLYALPNSGTRTISTLRKVNPVEGVLLKNINISQNFIGDVDKVVFEWGAYCTAKNISVDHGIEAGSALKIANSYGCEGVKCKAKHSMEDFVYGSAGGSGYDYYKHNDFIFRSGHNCKFTGCESTNGTQAFDVTFNIASEDTNTPSVDCTVTDWFTYNAQINPVTSHDGSIGTTIKNGVAKNSVRGISIRSREGSCKDNDIHISSKSQGKILTTNKYGIAMADGYTVGAVVSGNTIRNAYLSFKWSKQEDGFNYMNLTISGNTCIDCVRGLSVGKSSGHSDFVNTQDADLVFKDNEFTGLKGSMAYIGQYTHGVSIINNTTTGLASEMGSELINIEANCQDVTITRNIATKGTGGVPFVRAESLLDKVTFPEGTTHNINIFDNFDGSNDYDFRMDGSGIPKAYGPSISKGARKTITSFGDIDVLNTSVVVLNGDGDINNINGLADGESVLLKKNSHSNAIVFNETGNLLLHTGSTYTPAYSSILVQATNVSGTVYISPLAE